MVASLLFPHLPRAEQVGQGPALCHSDRSLSILQALFGVPPLNTPGLFLTLSDLTRLPGTPLMSILGTPGSHPLVVQSLSHF